MKTMLEGSHAMARLSVIRVGLTPELGKLGWLEQFENDALTYVRSDDSCRHFLRVDAAVQLSAWSEIEHSGVVAYREVAPFHVSEPHNMAGLSTTLGYLRKVHYGTAD